MYYSHGLSLSESYTRLKPFLFGRANTNNCPPAQSIFLPIVNRPITFLCPPISSLTSSPTSPIPCSAPSLLPLPQTPVYSAAQGLHTCCSRCLESNRTSFRSSLQVTSSVRVSPAQLHTAPCWPRAHISAHSLCLPGLPTKTPHTPTTRTSALGARGLLTFYS